MKNRKGSQKFKSYFKPQKFLGTFFSETLFLVTEIYFRRKNAEFLPKIFVLKNVASYWLLEVLPLSKEALKEVHPLGPLQLLCYR